MYLYCGKSIYDIWEYLTQNITLYYSLSQI